MTLKEIKRRHQQDLILRFAFHSTTFTLFLVIAGFAYHLTKLKNSGQLSSVQMRAPANVGYAEHNQWKIEVQRLQEENTKLRAALTVYQQTVRPQPLPKKIVSKKPSKFQRIAFQLKKQKKTKLIQVSFDERQPARN